MKRWIIAGLLALCGDGFAERAVSGPNGKAAVFGGDMNGDDGVNVDGSFSFPVGDRFGVQLDGIYTGVSDRDFYGAGGHFFWRKPSVGLFGATAGATRENDALSTWSAGLEGEYYLGMLTFGARGGVANIDYAIGPLPFIETDATGHYATGSVGVYPFENLLLSGAYTHALDNGMARGLVEYQSPLPGLSLFGDIAAGEHDYRHAMLGVRYYLGKKKTLRARHRQDDPASVTHDLLYLIGSYGAEFNKEAETFFEQVIANAVLVSGGSSWNFGNELTIGNGAYGGVGSAISGGNSIAIGDGFTGGSSGGSIGSGSANGGAIAIGEGGVAIIGGEFVVGGGAGEWNAIPR